MTGKYQAYPEYKDSGVEWIGDIPTHWKLTRIKYITECLDSARIPLNAQERGEMQGDIPYWGANKVVDYVNSFLFDEELILLGEDGAPFFDDTKDVAFNVSGKIWPNNHVHVLRPDLNYIEPRFLKYALNCADYHLYISGSTRDKLNQSDMNEIYIRVSDVPELRQIANFLDHETAKIDTLIEKQQQLIQLLKEKRQAVISHDFTKGLNTNAPMRYSGVEWLGEVPEHWQVTKIGWICDFISYGFTNPMPSSDEGPYMLTAADIEFGRINYEEARRTSEEAFTSLLTPKSKPVIGDVLLTKDGTLGRVALLEDECDVCISQSVALLRPDKKKVMPEFLTMALMGADYQRKMIFDAGGTTIKHIYISILAKMNLILPSLKEQSHILQILEIRLEKMDALIMQAEKASNLLTERRTALISAAVTGKIDVRGFKLPQEDKEPETLACAL